MLLAVLACTAHAATIQYVYDDLGRLIAVVDDTGKATVYSYDAAGNLVSVSNNAGTQLSIVAIVPDRGREGDTVTIYGSQFVPNPAQNSVSFNGTRAAVTAASAATLTTTVPAGATTGPITVSNVNGSATSAATFTVISPAVITAVTPNVVARGFVTPVQISGSNLRFATAVTFSQQGITAAIASGASNQTLPVSLRVSATVPPGAYSFTVSGAAGTTDSGLVTVSVGLAPSGDVMAVTRPLSAFFPPSNQVAAQIAPAGDVMSLSTPMSVLMAPPSEVVPQVAPSGDAMSVSRPLSVSMP